LQDSATKVIIKIEHEILTIFLILRAFINFICLTLKGFENKSI